MQIIEVCIPEYTLGNEPDFLAIGKKVDKAIEAKLPDGRYICRAIGYDDHPEKSPEELFNHIIETGTDKYNSDRKEVCYAEFSMYDHDMHAGAYEISDGKIVPDESDDVPSMFGDMVKKFYVNVLQDRGYRVRIDFLLIYDSQKVIKAEYIDKSKEKPRPELTDCLFKFKDKKNKKDALVAVIKVKR